MKLTILQRKTLELYQLFRSTNPTIGRQLCFNWFAWLPLVVIGAISCLFAFTPGFSGLGWWGVGMACGAFARDIGRFRGVVRVWPVFQEIINWRRVSELLEPNEKNDA